LIVDDLPNWRRQLLDTLAVGGYSAEAVGSAQEARHAIASGRFKLVVVDIRLIDAEESNVEGLELIKEIDARGLDIKVIAMTGYETTLIKQKASQSPTVVDFIIKDDFDIHRFFKAVEAAISSSDVA
jgi:DNA-binding NtrC family response regulator